MPSKGIRKYVIVDPQLNKWAESNYPNHSMSFFFNAFLRNFKEAHDHTPLDYAKVGAEALREEMVVIK